MADCIHPNGHCWSIPQPDGRQVCLWCSATTYIKTPIEPKEPAVTDLDTMALLPCPFCGGEPTECMDSADDPCRFIRCDTCDFDLMGGPVGIGWWPSLEAAAQAWNRRTAPPGYRLVPVELPLEMEVAFCEQWFSRRRAIDDASMQDCWDAALAIAPEPSP